MSRLKRLKRFNSALLLVALLTMELQPPDAKWGDSSAAQRRSQSRVFAIGDLACSYGASNASIDDAFWESFGAFTATYLGGLKPENFGAFDQVTDKIVRDAGTVYGVGFMVNF